MSIDPMPTLTLGGTLSAEAVATHVAKLVTAISATYLQRQRWFGGKANVITSVSLRDHVVVTRDSPIGLLLLVDVRFAVGARETYCLPVAVRPTSAFEALPNADWSHAMLRLEFDSGGAVLYDALVDEQFSGALLGQMASRGVLAGRDGAFVFHWTDAFAAPGLGSPDYTGLRSRMLGAEQSNTSIVFDRLLMFKVFRKLADGVNPDVEIGEFLTRRTSFRGVPLLAGRIEYEGARGPRFAIAMVQQFIANRGDGWTYTLAHLREFFAAIATRSADARMTSEARTDALVHAVRQREASYLAEAHRLGRITGELHRALASDRDDPAFAPEPVSPEDVERLTASLDERLKNTLTLLGRSVERLPPEVQRQARTVLGREASYRAAIARVAILAAIARDQTGALGQRTRCHGDYHLGQVLKTDEGFVVIDFEGEPARSLAERRAKMLPLRDVAGMRRSFDYAATAGLREAVAANGSDPAVLGPWARAWEQAAIGAFLSGYRAATDGAEFLPHSFPVFDQILQAFELEKALYELAYELDNRPDWVAIPLDHLARWSDPSSTRSSTR